MVDLRVADFATLQRPANDFIDFGTRVELTVAAVLVGSGHRVELAPNGTSFDFLLDGILRCEVKGARQPSRKGRTGTFNIGKSGYRYNRDGRHRPVSSDDADYFFLACVDGDWLRRLYWAPVKRLIGRAGITESGVRKLRCYSEEPEVRLIASKELVTVHDTLMRQHARAYALTLQASAA